MKFLIQTKFQLLIIVILTVGVYANSLPNKLVWDDHLFLENWSTIRSFDNLGKIFKGDAPNQQGKIYRPIRSVIYMLDYQLWGTNALGYRVQAVLLHLAVTVVVYLIVLELVHSSQFTASPESSRRVHSQSSTDYRLQTTAVDRRRKAVDKSAAVNREPKAKRTVNYLPFFAAFLFGLHPIHTETIDYISTSLETFGSLFFFLSFYLYLLATNKLQTINYKLKTKKSTTHYPLPTTNYLLSLFFAILAFFTYEMTLTLPLLIVLYDLCTKKFQISNFKFPMSNVRSLKGVEPLRYLPFFLAAVAFVAIRTSILGLVSRTDYLAYSFYHTMLTMVKVFTRYIGLLILPINQTAIHNLVGQFPSSMIPYDKLDPILNQTLFDFDVLLAITAILLLILLAIKTYRTNRTHRLISFSIFWFFISLLPVSYIIPHGGAMAEKYLYIPSFGFVLVLSYLGYLGYLRYLRFKEVFLVVFLSIAIFYAISTIIRNPVWQNDITLFTDVVKKSPNNLLAHYTLGIWYANYQNFDQAALHYQKAIDRAPEFLEARYNLANLYLRQKKYEQATEQYNNLLNIYPNYAQAKNILSNLDLIKKTNDTTLIEQLLIAYSKNGLKFNFPAYWSLNAPTPGVKAVSTPGVDFTSGVAAGVAAVILKDANGQFSVKISDVESLGKQTIEDYIKAQKDTHGTLVNQGLAQIPNVDTAYVKVWSDKAGSYDTGSKSIPDPVSGRQGSPGTKSQEASPASTPEVKDTSTSGVSVTKLQFFLFKDKKVVQILAYPADSPSMGTFDQILGSLKIE